MNGLNPQKMRQMMRQMGIRQEDVAAESVLIRCADKDIVIEHPEVAKVHMMGQETWQIVGRAREQPRAAEASTSWIIFVALSNAFEGMQPRLRHTPPSRLSCSIRTTFLPRSAA